MQWTADGMQGWRKGLAAGLVAAAAVYLALVAAAVALEPLLLYAPVTERAVPPLDEDPRIREVTITTADGQSLVGWYAPPDPGKPVLLFFDGRHGSLAGQRYRWRRIRKAGVGCLAIAWRGTAGSTGRPSETGLRLDAVAAWEWLARRHSPSDIVVHGHSLGTGPAVWLAQHRPMRALVLEAPFTAAVDVAQARAPLLPASLLMRDRFVSRDYIGAVRVPVLVVHGDRDSAVPYGQGEQLYRLANQPKRFVRVRGGDHLTLTRDGLYGHIWDFIGMRRAS